MKIFKNQFEKIILEELHRVLESSNSSLGPLFDSDDHEDIIQGLELFNASEGASVELKEMGTFLFWPNSGDDPEFYPQLTFSAQNQQELDTLANLLIDYSVLSYYFDSDYNVVKSYKTDGGYEVNLVNLSRQLS